MSARAVLLSLSLAVAAIHCGSPPPATPAPEAPSASAVTAPSTPPPPEMAPASATATPPPAPQAPLVVAKGCLAKEAVDGDVQARMKDAWKAAGLFEAGKPAELENEGSRKLTSHPLADLDGDGTEELTLADEGTGNYNQLTFLYVSNKGCWKFSHVTMAAAFSVPKAAPKKGSRDLGVVQKSSSCNDPKDKEGYVVTTLRASETGWTKARTTSCPCATSKAKKPTGDCAVELP